MHASTAIGRPARLLDDESAYREILARFVDGRLDATDFLAGFLHLWRRDAATASRPSAQADPPARDQTALYAVLDAVNALCEAYARALVPDGGYRVSEEQFRKEILCLVSGQSIDRHAGCVRDSIHSSHDVS